MPPKPEPAPKTSVLLICGNDEYSVSTAAAHAVESYIPAADRVMGIEVIDGQVDTADQAVDALSRCQQAVMTPGFFGASKAVWLKNVTFFSQGQMAKSPAIKEQAARLGDYVKAGLPEGVMLVVSACGLPASNPFHKALAAAGRVQVLDIPEKAYQAQKVAEQRLAEHLDRLGLEMTGELRQLFIERVGFDTRCIVNELEKLRVAVGEGGRIRREDVMELTAMSKEAMAWDLADAFGNRNLPATLAVFDRLMFQQEAPMALIAILQGRIRELLIYRDALDNGWVRVGDRSADWGAVPPEVESLFSECMSNDPRKGNPYRMGVLGRQAKGFTRAELETCRELALQAHEKLVRSTGLSGRVILEMFLIRALSQGRRPVPARA